MRGSGNFCQGDPGQSDKKNLRFLGVFFLSLLYRSIMVNLKEISYSRFRRVGGSNCLFPIETHISCDFPGEGGLDPLSSPLEQHLS